MSALDIFLAVLVIACVSVSAIAEECAYDESGICIRPCPLGTYSYSTSCSEDTMSQRTCRQPKARSMGQICDYSSCDCREPKVWDEVAQKCVMLQDCSDQSKINKLDPRV